MRLRGRISLRHPRETVREVLPNGVVLIAQEHRASDVVALQLWMRMGGRDEAAGELGLAHYIEHMLFKGTPTRPPGSIDTVIEGFGGASSAFTSYDTTHYDFVVPVEHLREVWSCSRISRPTRAFRRTRSRTRRRRSSRR
jgi:zinc protease